MCCRTVCKILSSLVTIFIKCSSQDRLIIFTKSSKRKAHTQLITMEKEVRSENQHALFEDYNVTTRDKVTSYKERVHRPFKHQPNLKNMKQFCSVLNVLQYNSIFFFGSYKKIMFLFKNQDRQVDALFKESVNGYIPTETDKKSGIHINIRRK